MLEEARRVPGVREAVTGALDVEAVLRRRDALVNDLHDDHQVPWLEDRGIVLFAADDLAGLIDDELHRPGRVAADEARSGAHARGMRDDDDLRAGIARLRLGPPDRGLGPGRRRDGS